MSTDTPNPAPFFYGLQPNWWSRDRLYRVYVSDKMLAGAYVAGQIYDEKAAALQLQQLRLFLSPLVNRWFRQRRQREALYDEIDPFAPGFLDLDEKNFHLPRTEIVRMTVYRQRSLWMPFNVGSVDIEKLDGTTLRLILIDEQDPELVLALLQAFHPDLETTGQPPPRRRSGAKTPADKRGAFLVLAVVLFALGGFFSYVALTGLAPHPLHLPVAALNVLAGLWCLAMAWRG